MQPDQIGALLTAAGIVIGSVAALVTAITSLVKAARAAKDDTPAPQVGITATVPDDIDIRAYNDAVDRAEKAEAWARYWMQRAAGENPTPPTDPGTPGAPSRKDTP